MTTASQTTRPAAATYTPATQIDAVLAEAIGCIITGRPLPEFLRAPAAESVRPASVEEGVRRILTGGTAAR
jgi:hypothetical protein